MTAMLNLQVKGKVVPLQAWIGPEDEKKYSSTLSWPRRLEDVCGQYHVPAALPPAKTR
jgi:hypothetical protein